MACAIGWEKGFLFSCSLRFFFFVSKALSLVPMFFGRGRGGGGQQLLTLKMEVRMRVEGQPTSIATSTNYRNLRLLLGPSRMRARIVGRTVAAFKVPGHNKVVSPNGFSNISPTTLTTRPPSFLHPRPLLPR